jgi:hypothetical protein
MVRFESSLFNDSKTESSCLNLDRDFARNSVQMESATSGIPPGCKILLS